MRLSVTILALAILLGLVYAWLTAPEQVPTTAGDSAPLPRSADTGSGLTPPAPAAAAPAARVDVDDDGETAAKAPSGVDLRGWIGDTDGSGVGDIEIEIESLGLDGEDIVTARTRSGASGDFVLRDLVAGRQYRLDIEPQGDFAAFSLDSFSSEDAAALERIQLQRITLVDVDGMIVDTDYSPVPNFELQVRSLAVEYPDRVIRSDSSGFFRLPAFPAGELRIATNASDYYRIRGLVLRPDEYRNLTLMIDRGSYHLSGWVGDDSGVPVEDAQITLKSAFATDEYHSYSYRTTVTDSNGGFEFAGLGGHRLTLGIYARGYESLIRQHDFESFADRIELRLRRQPPPTGEQQGTQ